MFSLHEGIFAVIFLLTFYYYIDFSFQYLVHQNEEVVIALDAAPSFLQVQMHFCSCFTAPSNSGDFARDDYR
jgi:hypothetical protein